MDTNYTMNVHQDPLAYVNNLEPINNFELLDFIDHPNFDQFIDLIRGENEDGIRNFGSNYLINECFVDNNNNQLLPSCPAISNANLNVYDLSSTAISSFSCFEGEVKGEEGENENDGGSSSTTTTITDTNKCSYGKPREKSDRSKTLISERRRRGRMKDKLYALRALVPNITKMDKASIIGDAASYVHDLQSQAKKLKAEVAGLEASLSVPENYQESINNNVQVTRNNHLICNKIMQVDMVQVEERGYYTKIVCNKGERVAASLYKALESLTDFNIQNSNLATVCDDYLLTFTLNVKSCDPEVNLPNLKLWVASALINQGFEFMQS